MEQQNLKRKLHCSAIGAIILAFAGCASTPKTGVEHAGEETVVTSMNDEGRPSWLDEGKPFQMNGDKVISIGQSQIPDGHNISAGFRMAESNAKSTISFTVLQKLSYMYQQVEGDTTLDANRVNYVATEASKVSTSYLQLSRRYWEKVRVVGENGHPSVQVRLFVMMEMPKDRFQSAVVDAIRAAEKKQGISTELAKKADASWWSAFEEANGSKPVTRDTASLSNDEEEDK